MKPKVDGVRVLRGHKKDCQALREYPDNPLRAYPFGSIFLGDKIGRRGAETYVWYYIDCTSADCGAAVQIRRDVITKYAHQLMRRALGETPPD